MNDKRLYLKIKLKSLAAEARIIRAEERKLKGMDKWNVQHHRKTVVRNAARQTLIAYQFIRGRNPSVHFSQCDLTRYQDYVWAEKMVKKYGSAEAVKALPLLQQAMQTTGPSGGNNGNETTGNTEDARDHAAGREQFDGAAQGFGDQFLQRVRGWFA